MTNSGKSRWENVSSFPFQIVILFNFLLGRTEKKASVCSTSNHKINSMGNLSTDAASILQSPHPTERKVIKMHFIRSIPLV